MKTLLFTIAFSFLPLISSAAMIGADNQSFLKQSNIPSKFVPSPDTAVMEWGCPVSELVKADSQAEAMQQLQNECAEEASREAADRPGVFEVIRAIIVWSDTHISKEAGGYAVKGTIFLETLVLQSADGELFQ